MAEQRVTAYNTVDFESQSTKLVGIKNGQVKQVQLGDAAEHDASDFAAANHTHNDVVKTVTVNGTTYTPTDGDVSFTVQGGGTVTVDDALSDSSENPVQNKVVKGAIDAKVDAVSGKGLSTNDYTTDEKNKLSGIESGAEVNVIESVSVNNTPLTPTSKAVNIDLSGYAQSNDLATVATSGDYTDLQNTPNLANVATSGSYNDLQNKPTIPTKISQLENDKRYIQNMEAVEMDGYKQLFYIESDGTQGITTSIIPNQNTGFEIEYLSNTAPTASNAPQLINAGGRGSQNRFAISMYKSGSLSGEVMVKTTSTNAKIDYNVRQILKYVNDGTNKTITYSDGSTVNVESSGDWTAKDTGGNDAPLIIFGLKSGSGYDRCFNGRLYRLKIYNLTTLAYDFVPAMRKSDNVVGLYEAVNDVFYTDDRVGATPFGHGDDEILDRISQLIMDKNIVTDNNFTNAYKNKIDTNAANIETLSESIPETVDVTIEYNITSVSANKYELELEDFQYDSGSVPDKSSNIQATVTANLYADVSGSTTKVGEYTLTTYGQLTINTVDMGGGQSVNAEHITIPLLFGEVFLNCEIVGVMGEYNLYTTTSLVESEIQSKVNYSDIEFETETTWNGSIESGKHYVISSPIASLTVNNVNYNTYQECTVTFTVSGSSFDVTLPSGTKIIGDKPIFLNGSTYIMSYYNGMVVFGEVNNYVNPS